MYRLTLDGVQAARSVGDGIRSVGDGRAGILNKRQVQTQRVYRWANCWGYFLPGAPAETAWFAERRIPEGHAIHADGTKFLLERVDPLSIDAPPMKIDDVWDEEVILFREGMVTTSVSVVGTKTELVAFADKNGVALPPDLDLSS